MMRAREVIFDGGDWQLTEGGLLVPPVGAAGCARYGDAPIGIDLFAGCGGFSLGFHSAGWDVLAASEIDPMAAMTYLYNLGESDCELHFVTPEDERAWKRAVAEQERYEHDHGNPRFFQIGGNPARPSLLRKGRLDPDVALSEARWAESEQTVGCQHFWLGDVRKISGQDMLDALGLQPGEVDAVFGGPPCQGFSVSGKRNVMDPRNSLVFEFCRLVLEIRPKTFVMENVPGMLSMVTAEGLPVIDAVCRVMSDGGFGTFDGLKRALLASSGAGAAMQGSTVRKGGRGANSTASDQAEQQLSLAEAMA